MDRNTRKAVVEAVLFAEGNSVGRDDLAKIMELSRAEVDETIADLRDKYAGKDSGIQLIELENAVQLCTKPDYYDYLIRLESAPKKLRLTDTVLETLSIIAYKQPVTKAEIEAIRGVNSDFAVDKLISYDLVQELGRKDAPGRPILFGTTEQFLRSFGVKSVQELPTLPEEKKEEFMAEAEEEVDARRETGDADGSAEDSEAGKTENPEG